MDGPSAADWLSAIGTVGALLIGMVILAREQFDRRRAQARMVNAWAVEVQPQRAETEEGVPIGRPDLGQTVVMTVVNASAEPVYDFLAWVRGNYACEAPHFGSMERRILPPGETTVYSDNVELPASGLAGLPDVVITFRDSAGRRWQRLPDGKLDVDRLSPDRRLSPAERWRVFRLRHLPNLRPRR